jgi:hypothetical protein
MFLSAHLRALCSCQTKPNRAAEKMREKYIPPSVQYNVFNIVEFRYNSNSGTTQAAITVIAACRPPLPLLIPLSTSLHCTVFRYNSNSGTTQAAITVIVACRAPLPLLIPLSTSLHCTVFRYNSNSGTTQAAITVIVACRAPLPLLIHLSTSRYNSDRGL